MKNLLKTVFLKTMVVVALLLAASLLVTCDLLFPPEDDGGEYTDVEYETIGAKGNERVKSVKLYLKPDSLDQDVLPGPGTYGVKKSAEQRRIERALTLEGARMSHDYFEAVFMIDATTVARAAWEIGQPAGITGLSRTTNTNFSPPGRPGEVGTNTTGSIIFVGRKTGKTLMGVGYLTNVNDAPVTTPAAPPVNAATTSVTFTVSPLATWVGFVGVGDPPDDVAPFAVNTFRTDVGTGTPPKHDTETGTLLTATGVAPTAAGLRAWTAATPLAATTGEMYTPFAGIRFPMYYLPSAKAANWPSTMTSTVVTQTIEARYLVGGLTSATIYSASGDLYSTFPSGGLSNGVRIWGTRPPGGAGGYPVVTETNNSLTATAALKGGIQFIKRTPAFMYEGLNYEINNIYTDKITKVTETAISGDTAFDGAMNIQFTITKGASGGIFAITFQVPVYALTPIRAGNISTLPPEKWFIRPDYSQYQYLLDDGKNAGGAVLIGTDVEGGAGNWIQINTTGIGFDNE